MLDQAFEALKKFDFGTPLSDVQAIEDAVVASNKDAAARKAIEQRLIMALGSSISRDAKDYVCRQLALVGSAASVPAVASLLANEGNAHLARHALERIPGVEAEAALASAAKSVWEIGRHRHPRQLAKQHGCSSRSSRSVIAGSHWGSRSCKRFAISHEVSARGQEFDDRCVAQLCRIASDSKEVKGSDCDLFRIG
jgi:hypothetical protein